jgi:DNA-binding transcriptional ArsR family regulator
MTAFAGNIGSASTANGTTSDILTSINVHSPVNTFQPVKVSTRNILFNTPIDYRAIALDLNADGLISNFPHVSRARSQVYLNDNRNTMLKFIESNPGSTLYDISKSLGINIGTARYHLMILTLNHLVAPYNDGPRRIRYFSNNGAYDEKSMKAMALLKREPTSKIIGALLGNPGIANSGISAISGLAYSDVNRYLKELTTKGVVIRVPTGNEKYGYRIAPEMLESISGAILKKDMTNSSF